MTRSSRLRKLLLRFGAFLALTAAVIAGAEMTARFLTVPPPGFDRPPYLLDPGRFRPIRERSLPGPKPPGTFRIVVLGDSYTWGAGVPFDLTYARHLEWLLNVASRRRYEVWNLGASGATTADEVRRLPKAEALQPDLILIGYFLDDPELAPDVPPEILAVHTALKNRPGWRRWLVRHSVLYRRRAYRRWSRKLRRAQVRYIEKLYLPGSRYRRVFEENLRRFAQFRERTGIPIRFVIWPHLGFSPNESYPFRSIHEDLTRRLQSLGFPVLDLLRVFAGMDPRRLQAVPEYDPHPSEIAHRLAAEALFEWLNKTRSDFAAYLVTPRLHPNTPMQSVRLRMAPIGRF